MSEESSARPAATNNIAVFPVVLYDGDKETNYGYITIHSDLLYKEFQKKITELLRISYNKLSTYLVENKSNIPERRKILISGRVDFGVIVKLQNLYFLVVLKRLTYTRDRLRKYNKYCELGFQIQNQNQINPYYYNDHVNDLMFRKENNLKSNVNLNFSAIHEVYPRVSTNVDRLLCLKCKVPEFHCCVYDVVIQGFYRSRFGPIARPR